MEFRSHFDYIEDDIVYVITATPAFPGLTGSETLVVVGSAAEVVAPGGGEIVSFPTAGADANREEAFAAIRQCAQEVVADLIFAEADSEPRLVRLSSRTPTTLPTRSSPSLATMGL